MNNILERLREELLANSDEHTQETGQHFFKEKVTLYGVKTALVTKIGNQFFKEIKDFPKSEIFKLCEELWGANMLEETFIACNWSHKLSKQFEEADFELFEKWVKTYINNWASCDTFCNHTMGDFLTKFPQYISKLKEWTKSENRWVRRASAVSLIVPARNGKFKDDVFEIADLLLLDSDDMVQKGYGWLLKVTCNKYEEDVYDYVISKRSIMPRTSLRYAIEKMPKHLKEEAMKKGKK